MQLYSWIVKYKVKSLKNCFGKNVRFKLSKTFREKFWEVHSKRLTRSSSALSSSQVSTSVCDTLADGTIGSFRNYMKLWMEK